MTEHSQGSDPNQFLWSSNGIKNVPAETPSKPVPPSPDQARKPISPSELRKYPRLDLKLPVLYKIINDVPSNMEGALPRPFQPTRSDNISPTGACLLLAEHLGFGTLLALSIHLENRQKFSAVAKVVWSQATDVEHHHLTGIEFMVVYRKIVTTETAYVTPEVLEEILNQS